MSDERASTASEVPRVAMRPQGAFGIRGMGGRPDPRAMRYGEHPKPKDLGGTLRRLWGLTRGRRLPLLGIFALSAIVAASPVLSPLIIGRAIDAISAGEPVQLFIALLLAVYLGDWMARAGQQLAMVTVGQRIVRDVRLALLRSMEGLPLAVFDRHRHGELMSRIANDVDNISTTLTNSLAQIMVYVFSIGGALVAMLSLNLVLTAVALVSTVFVVLAARFITRRTRPLFREQQARLGRLNGHIEESVSGLSMVKAFCREDSMAQTFAQANEEFRSVAMKAQVWSGVLMPLTNVINNLSFINVAIAGGLMAAQGLIGPGMISSFLLYSRQFNRPFVDMANIYNTLQSAVAGAERVFEIMDETPEPADAEGALACDNVHGDVEFCHVTFGYDARLPVIRDFSLRVPHGTRVAIVGETGSGKTTLVNLLARLYDVDDGAILLDGRDLRDYRLHELRRAFGTVLQDPALFTATVAENICYGRTGDAGEALAADEARELARAAARTVGADAFIERLPQGYDTVLEQAGAALSQGERQLLTVARAVVADAPILVLDEATSSVDTVTEQKIRAAMLGMTRGRTSFVIAHRLSTIRDSDLIVVLEDGAIAEQGTHDELLALDGRYAAMWRTQVGARGV